MILSLFSKQREQRKEIAWQTQQVNALVFQLHAAQEQLLNVQENLKNCLIYMKQQQTEMENLTARNADLEDEVARVKHRKLPTREKV